MQRITEKMLENLADRINAATDSPDKPWGDHKDGSKANIGNYHISYAYGGACLHRMMNKGGGVNCPIQDYHSPKRELFGKMDAYLSGLSDRVLIP